MSIGHLLKTPVEIYRDGEKLLKTEANIQKGRIYLKDVDVRRLDIIRVIPTSEEFEVIDHPYKQLHQGTNKVLYIEAKVRRS
jgi:hypothetical protein